MNIRIVFGVMLAALLGAGAARADCIYPKEPSNTPDGLTATEEEMVEGMKAVRKYNDEVTAYLSCLEMEMNAQIEAAGPDAPPEHIEQIKAIHNKRHNAAVEALETHATHFNEQVRAYKGRDKKS